MCLFSTEKCPHCNLPIRAKRTTCFPRRLHKRLFDPMCRYYKEEKQVSSTLCWTCAGEDSDEEPGHELGEEGKVENRVEGSRLEPDSGSKSKSEPESAPKLEEEQKETEEEKGVTQEEDKEIEVQGEDGEVGEGDKEDPNETRLSFALAMDEVRRKTGMGLDVGGDVIMCNGTLTNVERASRLFGGCRDGVMKVDGE